MKWIGLTGGIGVGKSTVAHILRQKGISVVDADALSHRVLEKPEIIEKIISHFDANEVCFFKKDILKRAIDRKALGRIVFSDSRKKAILEGILHPEIKAMVDQCRRDLEVTGRPLAVYDVPLLFEKNIEDEFDFIVLVACDREIVFKRLEKRGDLMPDVIERIMALQTPQKEKLKRADFVIWNNTDLKDLEEQCHHFLNLLTTKFGL